VSPFFGPFRESLRREANVRAAVGVTFQQAGWVRNDFVESG